MSERLIPEELYRNLLAEILTQSERIAELEKRQPLWFEALSVEQAGEIAELRTRLSELDAENDDLQALELQARAQLFQLQAELQLPENQRVLEIRRLEDELAGALAEAKMAKTLGAMDHRALRPCRDIDGVKTHEAALAKLKELKTSGAK